MNYRYTLLIGLLVSTHVLMGNERDGQLRHAIFKISSNPNYEDCKQFTDVLAKYLCLSEKDDCSVVIKNDGIWYRKYRETKVCYDSISGRIRDMPDYCRRKSSAVAEQRKELNDKQGKIKEKEINVNNCSWKLFNGLFLLGITGKLMKVGLTEKNWFSINGILAVVALSTSWVTGYQGTSLLLDSSYEIYSGIRFNNSVQYNIKNSQSQEDIKKLTDEMNGWEELEAQWNTIQKY